MNPIEAVLRRKPAIKQREHVVLDKCNNDDTASFGKFIIKVDHDHIDVYQRQLNTVGKIGSYRNWFLMYSRTWNQ